MTGGGDAEQVIEAFARQFVDGSFDESAALLSADGRRAVVESFPDGFQDDSMGAADALEAYWFGLHSQYGETEGYAVTLGERIGEDQREGTVEFAFEAGSEVARIAVGEERGAFDGESAVGIEAFSFDPAYEPPTYVDRDAFTDREVTVDAGDVALDGVLAVPEGDGTVPGVALVHGAGIHGIDGGDGASKLLRDLAWGLATNGVASLRYEKRLAEHDVPDDEFTLDSVVVDDAVAAVDRLATAGAVDETATVVAGHSQGGMAAPRIAAQHGGLAGVVNLDGPPSPILDPEDADVIRYEFDRDGELDEAQAAQLEEDRETYRRLNEGEFDDDETIMGRPGVWFRSLLEYDPVATASELDVPVFVANTHVVDPAEKPELDAFLRKNHDGWKTADLPPGSDVRLYHGVSHHFQPSYKPWTPLSLYFGGNVAARVVTDLTEWIETARRR